MLCSIASSTLLLVLKQRIAHLRDFENYLSNPQYRQVSSDIFKDIWRRSSMNARVESEIFLVRRSLKNIELIVWTASPAIKIIHVAAEKWYHYSFHKVQTEREL